MYLIKCTRLLFVATLIVILIGCSPDVGSDEWCQDMKEKPKGDWTASETADYAKHCVF